MRKQLLHFFGALLISATISSTAWAQSAEQALQTVKQSVSVVLADLKANEATYRSNPASLNRMIDQKMLPYFDTDSMAKLVLGTNWKSASKSQKSEFINAFKTMIMRKYAIQLLDFTDATVEYAQPTKVKRKRTKIKATVTNQNGKSYPLVLSMSYRQGKWRGYDVSLDGISVITTYRSSVGEEVSRRGLQAVIDDIKSKNASGAVE